MKLRNMVLIALSAALSNAGAQTAPPSTPAPQPQWFTVSPGAYFETGDTWTNGGKRFQLYGVQSCLRGARFTNNNGQVRDCGDASMAVLISLIRDLRPLCYEAARRPDINTAYVFCFATMTQGPAKGSRIDLGTALISIGYAFAALRPDGQPVHAPYYAAQLVAQRDNLGLWAFSDVPNPNIAIIRAYQQSHPPKASESEQPR